MRAEDVLSAFVNAPVLVAATFCARITSVSALFGDMDGTSLVEGMILAEHPEIQAAWIISGGNRRDTVVRLAQCGHHAVLAELRRLVWHYPFRIHDAHLASVRCNF